MGGGGVSRGSPNLAMSQGLECAGTFSRPPWENPPALGKPLRETVGCWRGDPRGAEGAEGHWTHLPPGTRPHRGAGKKPPE